MENYKPFREQFLECGQNGNLITVDVSKYNLFKEDERRFPQKILVCVKYRCVCSSKVCAGERIGEKNEYPDPNDYSENVGC